MPKTARNLWPMVYAFANVHDAWKSAARGRHDREYVMRFEQNLEANLFDLIDRLKNRTWAPGKWTVFSVYEPKKRIIHAPQFKDRVAHHAVVRVIQPYFESRFIEDSYACRAFKGTHAASNRLLEMLRQCSRNGTTYFIKADIAKYFPNIQHDILMRQAARTIGDRDVLWFLSRAMQVEGYDGVGLPIGALPSQLLANVYLDPFDHFMKDKMGVRYYLRYMDDFIVVHNDKSYLKLLLDTIRQWLGDNLKLEMNRKTGIGAMVNGVDFAGYRHWATHKLPRKKNVARAKRVFRKLRSLYETGCIDLEDVRPVVASFCGYMKHCSGYRTCGSMLVSNCKNFEHYS